MRAPLVSLSCAMTLACGGAPRADDATDHAGPDEASSAPRDPQEGDIDGRYVHGIRVNGPRPHGHGALDDHAAHHPGAHGHRQGHHGQGHAHGFSDVGRFALIFDDPARDAWQMPEHVVELLAIEPGMTVVDLGAGTGYFLPHLSRAVGPEGCVVALDVEPRMVEHMEARIQEAGWDNVVARVAAPDDPGLAPGAAHRVLVVDTWHHIGAREDYAARVRDGLVSGGQLVIVDFTLESAEGPPPAMRLSGEAVLRELAPSGLRATVLEERLPNQWLIRATRADGAPSPEGQSTDTNPCRR